MEDRSVVSYEHYREATQRFEYFFTGIIGALCAYISQSFTSIKIGFNSNTIELLSLSILFLSFFFSIKRLEKIIQLFRDVHKKIDAADKKGKLVTNIDIAPFVNEKTGQVYTLDDIKKEIALIDLLLPRLENNLETLNTTAIKYYKLRNRFFYLGFILLIISKVLFVA